MCLIMQGVMFILLLCRSSELIWLKKVVSLYSLLHTPLGRCVVNLDEVALGRLKLKFNVCYMMAKQSLPFAKYPPLLELQAHHGADLGSSYNTPDSAKIFTTYIAKSLWQSFLNTISASNISFFSFLDSNNQDDELIAVVYCAKNNLTEELSVCTCFHITLQSNTG